jgi:hypothetical protein
VSARRAPLALAAALALAARAGAFEIASPAEGARVVPVAVVRVGVAPDPGESIAAVSATALGDLATAAPGALSLDVPIPADAVGPLVIVVFAERGDGSRAAEFVRVRVDAGPLDRLEIGAPPLLRRVGAVAELDVRGLFADGVARDLTHPDRGTTYASSNPDVLAVHPSGLVQARSRGTAQVLVQSHGRSATATIAVAVPSPPDHGIPSADAGPDQTVAPETVVDLDGRASADPDADALRFAWEQTAGPFVIVRDTDTARPYFLAPFVEAPEVLEFSLVVEDARGATSFPDVVRITVAP